MGRSDINLDEAMPCAEDSEPYLEGDIGTPGLWDDNDLSSSDQADYLGSE